jgi:PAS domain S-box-containing protein
MQSGTDAVGLARLAQARENRAVETLRVSDARYRRLFETAQDGILILDAETGQVVDANPFLKELLGYSQEEFLGRKLWEIGPFKGEDASRNVFARLQTNDRLRYEGLPLETKDGRRVEVEFISNAYEVDGIRFIHCNIRDITKRMRTEEQLKVSFKEIGDLKAALDEHAIVAITDSQGKITYANDKFCAISQYSREELLGQDHRIINSGYHSKEFIRDLWTTITDGKVWKGEIKNKAKDGSFYWVDTTIVPFLNEDGKPRQYVAIRADMTERMRVNRALEAANHELAFQVEEKTKRADELAVIVEERTAADVELAFQVAEKSKRADELAAIVEERTLANVELEFQVEEKGKRADELAAIVEERTAASVELEFQVEEKGRRADELAVIVEERTAVDVELAFQVAEKGKCVDELAVIVEERTVANKELAFQVAEKGKRADELAVIVEERKAANVELAFQVEEKAKRADELAAINAKLTRSKEALEKSNVDLGQFAYIASHDLQTPLRNISGFVQLLQQNYADKLDEKASDWIRRTVQAAEQMHTLIRDVLEYSRVDSRERPFEPISLGDIFNDSVGLLEASIRDAGGKVTCDELPTVMGDRSQLVQLLQNLIGNGLKYHGEKPPHVHVSAQQEGSQWTISIRDNGIGIAPRHQARIFEIFKRLHNQQEYPGTGIGLAVCRRVVHRHGGKIRVESEAGRGSTFLFTIPEPTPPNP